MRSAVEAVEGETSGSRGCLLYVLFFPSRLVDDVMQMNVPSESVDIVLDKALNANHEKCNLL